MYPIYSPPVMWAESGPTEGEPGGKRETPAAQKAI